MNKNPRKYKIKSIGNKFFFAYYNNRNLEYTISYSNIYKTYKIVNFINLYAPNKLIFKSLNDIKRFLYKKDRTYSSNRIRRFYKN